MYADKVDSVFSSQLLNWELAKNNYDLLGSVRVRIVDFGTYHVKVQFNPSRMRSSAARTDAKSIGERPCFLCSLNRPAEQEGVDFEEDMVILVNPYPIFPRHLTIPSYSHTPQRIANNLGRMLRLAEALPDYAIFYNGPGCGASAPDHFHFQAGNRGFMPVEKDFLSNAILLSSKNGMKIWEWPDYKRTMLTITCNDKSLLSEAFNGFYRAFSGRQSDLEEPMLNIIAYYNPEEWVIHLMPRRLHRPWQFFEEGDRQILLSPASVDLGGVIITPLEEDFMKISKEDITDIFLQVCLEKKDLLPLIKAIV